MAEITIKFSEEDLHKLRDLRDGEELEIGSYFGIRKRGDIVEVLHGNGDEGWLADFYLTTIRPDWNYTLLDNSKE